MTKIRVREQARFSAERMAKVALAATSRVLLDLYCLEPGQAQTVHSHADQDKIYFVLEGQGRFRLDEAEETLEAGEALAAPAGVRHGVANESGRRLLVLVLVAPPPPHAG
ncbi:MAG TPA: cupin domain-containing protein [Methylomirabilota bacterium]|nr:cupin domain-containing protein [Methylomirabilota bacterium]